MSWDNDGSFDQEYYNSRCYPEEFDSEEEYELEFGNHATRHMSGRSYSSGHSSVGIWIFWTLFLYVGFHVLVIAALFPPLGALGFLGMIRVKEWLGY